MKRLLTLAVSAALSMQVPVGVALISAATLAPQVYALSAQCTKEIEALEAALPVLDSVKDEASAKEAAKKLKEIFDALPVITKAGSMEMEALAAAQNKASERMFKLKNETYFVSSGLQEVWTLMTDHFSRRQAVQPK